MPDNTANRLLAHRKTHVSSERPPFERIALILQGGGALGAYQAGVYQALAEANLHPDWVSGISIGAINSALIAGNPPERRVARLREFWETVSASPFGVPDIARVWKVETSSRTPAIQPGALMVSTDWWRAGVLSTACAAAILYPNGAPEALSYYDVAPLAVDAGTLGRLSP